MDVKNKVIIITGASQGIGFETAKLLSSLGARVVLAARSEPRLKQLESELPNSFAVPTDMRSHAEIADLIEKTLEKFGRIDVLINNAGQGIYGPAEKISLDDFRSVFELNVVAVLDAMQQVIPQMRKQGGGMIINVSSGVSRAYYPFLSGYAATKYALNAITFTSKQELEKDNIIVSTILPKMTATDFGKNAVGQPPDFSNRPGGMPQVDSAEFVASKILELVKTEQPEVQL